MEIVKKLINMLAEYVMINDLQGLMTEDPDIKNETQLNLNIYIARLKGDLTTKILEQLKLLEKYLKNIKH